MPAKSEFAAQPEIGVLGLREPRRSDPVICRGSSAVGRNSFRARNSGNGMRFARGQNSENTNPNLGTCGTGTNGRRSPRLGSCAGSKPLLAYGASRQSATLADITNVAGGRASHVEKVKPQKTLGTSASVAALAAAIEPTPTEERFIPVGLVDDVERSNVQSVAEYASDIFNDLFREEMLYLPRADYMDSQADITAKMRTILIDWLIEVHMKYRLRDETLHLTINLVDRYLTRMPVLRKRLQLVGVVSMFIASKFEEIHPPELHDWVYITDNAYTKDDVLVMECNMLSTLNFQVMVPTAAHFFEGLQKVNGCSSTHREVAQYLLELGLLDIRMLQYRPSHVVSAALLLSNELMGRSVLWPTIMVQHSHHAEVALRGCAEELRQLHEADKAGAGGQLQAVHKKFSHPQHHSVATMSF